MQVPIYDLLRKYDGAREQASPATGRRTMRVLSLPPYLIVSIARFTRNRFFVEKNPTIVNFPVKNLNLRGCIADLPRQKAVKSAGGTAVEVAAVAAGATNGAAAHGAAAAQPPPQSPAAAQHTVPQQQPVYGYNLLASISHVGDKRPDGVYKMYVHRGADGTWQEVQDLRVQETQAEAVAITEALLQVRSGAFDM